MLVLEGAVDMYMHYLVLFKRSLASGMTVFCLLHDNKWQAISVAKMCSQAKESGAYVSDWQHPSAYF